MDFAICFNFPLDFFLSLFLLSVRFFVQFVSTVADQTQPQRSDEARKSHTAQICRPTVSRCSHVCIYTRHTPMYGNDFNFARLIHSLNSTTTRKKCITTQKWKSQTKKSDLRIAHTEKQRKKRRADKKKQLKRKQKIKSRCIYN